MDPSPERVHSTSLVDVLITGQLATRTSRPPDSRAEAQGLSALADIMAETPSEVLQRVVDTAMLLCGADSAGLSILEPGGADAMLRWHATAGALAHSVNRTMPREDSPCGEVLSRGAVQLFDRGARYFPALRDIQPPIYEHLVAPWHIQGEPVGTLWVAGHSSACHFDAEHARLLASLGRVVASAWHMRQAQETLRVAAWQDRVRAALTEAVRPVSDAAQIQAAAARVLGTYLGASRVHYVALSDDGEYGRVQAEYREEGLPSVAGGRQIDDYGRAVLKEGRTLLVSNVAEDPRLSAADRAALKIGAYVIVPLIKSSRPTALLVVHRTQPHAWTGGEVELIEETAERTWAEVERTRAERALRDSEDKCRTLLDSMDQGYFLTEVIMDEHDRPVDVLYLEENLSATRMVGQKFVGRRLTDISSSDESHWYDIFGRVARTGVGERLKRYAEPDKKWLDFHVFKVGGADSRRVAVIFQDITERERAEEELRYRSEQFEALLNRAPLGLYLVDADFRLAQINPVALQVFGDIPDLIGRDFDHVIHILWPRADADELVRIFRHTLETGESYHRPEWAERRSDRGVTEYYEWRVDRITLTDGRHGVVCYFRDISDQVQARQSIAQSEARYRTLFESMDQGFCVFQMLFDAEDRPIDYRWVETNPAFERHTGLVGTAGKTARELVPDLEEHWVEIYGRVAMTGQRERFTEESQAMGRSFEVEAFRVGDPEERKVALLFTDITERKRAEDQLRASELRLRRIAESGIVGVVYWDLDGHVLSANEAFLTLVGYTREELEAGRIDWRAMTPPEWAQADARGVAQLQARGTMDTFEKEFLHKNGTRVPVLVTGATFEGESHCGVTLVQDITDRKRIETQLRDSEERLRRFAGQLEQRVQERTEELLQSQAQLRAFASELNLAEQRERNRLAGELHDHLQQMLVLGKLKLAQSKRLAEPIPACGELIKQTDEVLSDALRYTRTLVTELSPPVLREHGLAAGLKWLSEYMKKHDMAVQVDMPEESALQLPEEQVLLLFQSVRELLINAWKHAKTGHAMVRLRAQGGQLRIEVRDEGVGCDASVETGAADQGGLSSKFGLFAIRERMKALGGSFELNSVRGQGTTGTLTLPLSGRTASDQLRVTGDDQNETIGPQPSAVSSENASRITGHESRSPIRVLLVDDHAMMRQGLRSVLDAYADVDVVGEAGDGLEAVTLVEQLRPAVVVMDINMPNMGGIEATSRIKARFPDTVVIGLSVNATPDNWQAMKKAGATALVTKEAAVEQLYQWLQEAVTRR
jgi:PAS domain S-box-containing protein